jgi:hypothetical protein
MRDMDDAYDLYNLRPHFTWRAGDHGVDSSACLLCQRPLARPPRLWVHCVSGDIRLAAPVDADPDDIDEAGDMGWWPVGADCGKHLPAAYVTAAPRRRSA